MIRPSYSLLAAAALAVALAGPAAAVARGENAPIRVAQAEATDLVVRIDRLEEQIRQLTGAVEQLQYRNQQLEQQVRRIQGGADPGSPNVRFAPQAGQPGAAPQADRSAGGADGSAATAPAPQAGQRRAEVFDPNQNPNAPGAPRTLGQLALEASTGDAPSAPSPPGAAGPGGRSAGAPLDLGTTSGVPPDVPTVIPAPEFTPGAGPLPAPPPRYPSATGAQKLVMAPTATPKDEYDLAYGYVLRKDYALAEESFRAFLKQFPNDRLAPDATYWLGESLFQRQRYRDAAESFLTVSTRFENGPRAPESLLRLGQSLAALGEKDAACATFGQVGRKYPRAAHLRQAVEREQKRAGC